MAAVPRGLSAFGGKQRLPGLWPRVLPAARGGKSGCDRCRERETQDRAVRWICRLWQDLGSNEVLLKALFPGEGAAELGPSASSFAFPLQNRPAENPDVKTPSTPAFGRRAAQQTPAGCPSPRCLVSGRAGGCRPPGSDGWPRSWPRGTIALDKAVCPVPPQRRAPRRHIIQIKR